MNNLFFMYFTCIVHIWISFYLGAILCWFFVYELCQIADPSTWRIRRRMWSQLQWTVRWKVVQNNDWVWKWRRPFCFRTCLQLWTKEYPPRQRFWSWFLVSYMNLTNVISRELLLKQTRKLRTSLILMGIPLFLEVQVNRKYPK